MVNNKQSFLPLKRKIEIHNLEFPLVSFLLTVFPSVIHCDILQRTLIAHLENSSMLVSTTTMQELVLEYTVVPMKHMGIMRCVK